MENINFEIIILENGNFCINKKIHCKIKTDHCTSNKVVNSYHVEVNGSANSKIGTMRTLPIFELRDILQSSMLRWLRNPKMFLDLFFFSHLDECCCLNFLSITRRNVTPYHNVSMDEWVGLQWEREEVIRGQCISNHSPCVPIDLLRYGNLRNWFSLIF